MLPNIEYNTMTSNQSIRLAIAAYSIAMWETTNHHQSDSKRWCVRWIFSHGLRTYILYEFPLLIVILYILYFQGILVGRRWDIRPLDSDNQIRTRSIWMICLGANHIDHFRNLTYKDTMTLKWFIENCAHLDYLVKFDDDVFANEMLSLFSLFGWKESQKFHFVFRV